MNQWRMIENRLSGQEKFITLKDMGKISLNFSELTGLDTKTLWLNFKR